MTATNTIQEHIDIIRALRRQLSDALATIDELEQQLVTPSSEVSDEPVASPVNADAGNDTGSIRTDVIIHNISSPSMARDAQAHLASHAGVTNATVRELADGTLRITVESERGIGASVLADWEPARNRGARTATAHVLEIDLGEPVIAELQGE